MAEGRVRKAAEHGINYGASSALSVALIKVFERFGVSLTVEESVVLVAAVTWLVHRIRPVLDGWLSRLRGAPIALLFILLLPTEARGDDSLFSTDIVCTSSVVDAVKVDPHADDGSGSELVHRCVGHRVTMSLATGIDYAVLRLTGERGVVAFGAPTAGVAFDYSPPDWEWPVPLIGGQITLGMTAIDPDLQLDYVSMIGAATITVLGIFAFGGGFIAGIATEGGLPDTIDAALTGGIRVPTF